METNHTAAEIRRVSIKNQAEFHILGETEDFLAVDKPAGLLVHPTKPGGPRTLWDGLRDLLGYEICTGGQVSIINRLDRETSGVVLVAKSAAAARRAGLAMQRGEIRKEYQALVFGWPEWAHLTVDAPILRKGEVMATEVWLERAVHETGAESRTDFLVEGLFQDAAGRQFALVQARPLTGRTHQIRVHLAHLGFPVVGDKIYARGSRLYLDFIEHGWTPALEESLWLPRHALHCTSMELQETRWTAPLPADMEQLIATSIR